MNHLALESLRDFEGGRAQVFSYSASHATLVVQLERMTIAYVWLTTTKTIAAPYLEWSNAHLTCEREGELFVLRDPCGFRAVGRNVTITTTV